MILLYLESFGNPRKFARIARRVGAHEADRRGQGAAARPRARAPPPRTPARCSPPPTAAVDALFRQAGVIRADTLGELFDVAALLAHQPLPAGARVAIVTNAGGPGHPRAPTPARRPGSSVAAAAEPSCRGALRSVARPRTRRSRTPST